MQVPNRWIRGATAFVALLMLVPAIHDTRTRLNPEAADAWRERIQVERPEDVGRMILEGRKVVFVDVREPAEYAEFHLPGALDIPLRDVESDPRSSAASLADADLVIPYCLKDFRGYEGARKLQAMGLDNLGLMEGYGINAWQRAALPVAGQLPAVSDREALEALARVLGLPLEPAGAAPPDAPEPEENEAEAAPSTEAPSAESSENQLPGAGPEEAPASETLGGAVEEALESGTAGDPAP